MRPLEICGIELRLERGLVDDMGYQSEKTADIWRSTMPEKDNLENDDDDGLWNFEAFFTI